MDTFLCFIVGTKVKAIMLAFFLLSVALIKLFSNLEFIRCLGL